MQTKPLKQLIDDHWEFIASMIDLHKLVPVDTKALIEFYFRRAFEHGYKHAKEERGEDI
jgi:pantothenate kinase